MIGIATLSISLTRALAGFAAAYHRAHTDSTDASHTRLSAASAIIETTPSARITEHAALVYRKVDDPEAEVAVLQRYSAHFPLGLGPCKITARLRTALELRA
ncbi:hypothetical protein [Nocardia sp. NPDC003183]